MTGFGLVTLAHGGTQDWHDLLLLGSVVVAPAILLAGVLVVGRLRGDADDDCADDAAAEDDDTEDEAVGTGGRPAEPG